MTNETKNGTLDLQDPESDPGAAAVRRYFFGLGQDVNGMQQLIADEAQVGRFVYNMQVRWPGKENPGFLCILKAYEDEGPVIAFHNTHQFLDAVTGFTHRKRAGQLEWRQDDYPKDGWVDELAHRHSQQRYLK